MRGPAVNNRNRNLLLPAVVGLAGVVFVVDLTLPQAVVSMLYMPVVLFSVRLQSPRYTLLTAAGCSVLAAVDWIQALPNSTESYAVMNRSLALSAVWLSAFVGLIINRQTAELVELKTRQAEQAQRLLLSKAIA